MRRAAATSTRSAAAGEATRVVAESLAARGRRPTFNQRDPDNSTIGSAVQMWSRPSKRGRA